MALACECNEGTSTAILCFKDYKFKHKKSSKRLKLFSEITPRDIQYRIIPKVGLL